MRSGEEEAEERKSFRLPGWVRDVGMKILPWAITAIIAASAGLYIDNIGNKRDIAREVWRSDQQDARLSRFEGKQDKIEERINEMRDDQEAFKGMLIDRLDALIEKRSRRER
jgi:hypothetical protein